MEIKMILTTLPSPGLYSNSQKLRIEAVKAISSVELVAPTDRAEVLRDFFFACAVEANKSAVVQTVLSNEPEPEPEPEE